MPSREISHKNEARSKVFTSVIFFPGGMVRYGVWWFSGSSFASLAHIENMMCVYKKAIGKV